MQVFKDGGNPQREWTISITYGSLKRVKDLLGIDLASPMDGDPPLLTRLDTDIFLMCNTLYVLCKPEADARGISDEQFGELLGPHAICAARHAFFEEWRFFSQTLGRPDLTKAVEKQQVFMRKVIDRAAQEIGSPKLDEILDRHLAKVSIDASNLPGALE